MGRGCDQARPHGIYWVEMQAREAVVASLSLAVLPGRLGPSSPAASIGQDGSAAASVGVQPGTVLAQMRPPAGQFRK